MLSPRLARVFRMVKISSCLRKRLALSMPLAAAISSSSVMGFCLSSERCMGGAWIGSLERAGRGKDWSRTVLRAGGAGAPSGENWSLDVAVDEGGELRLGQRADLGGLDVAVLEDHQGGDAADAELRRGGLVFIDVELAHLELAGVFLGHFVEDRRDHLAVAAPVRPVIHQHRHAGLQDFLLEGIVGYVMNMFAHW